MAIYTQYGRFIKAKLFKEELESQGDTYMLLGLGNPFWDDSNSGQSIPVAPYDTSIINPNNQVNNNQFLDSNLSQYFYLNDDQSPTPTMLGGEVQSGTDIGKYIERCKDLLPPFPCLWKNYNNNKIIFEIGQQPSQDNVTQNNYENYYIEPASSNLYLYNSNQYVANIDFNTLEDDKKQFYAELFLRGLSKAAGLKHPIGLLGAVKCDISFVRDIGSDVSNYTGEITQFWYGDRYWEIVDPNEEDLDSYLNEDRKVYPHHLLFSATINPRQLCSYNLLVDQSLIPRQIALYTTKKFAPTIIDDDPPYLARTVSAPTSFRVDEWLFNFGQYSQTEINSIKNNNENPFHDKILNFTLPCTVGDQQSTYTTPDGDFKFILNDYIKGSIRQPHSVDRIGYIVGF